MSDFVLLLGLVGVGAILLTLWVFSKEEDSDDVPPDKWDIV
jgi:hypothetical protein